MSTSGEVLIFFHPVVNVTGCSPTETGYRDGNVYVKLTVFCYVYQIIDFSKAGKKKISSLTFVFLFFLVLFSVFLWPVLLMHFKSL